MDRIRRAVSQLGRDRSFVRRLPQDLGGANYIASLEGGLKYLRRGSEIDSVLAGFAQRFVLPGSVIWDVGANLGLFSFIAAGLAAPHGRVICVEPDPWLADQIRQGRDTNKGRTIAEIDIVVSAAAERYGLARLHIANRSRATNYIEGFGSTVTQGSRYSIMSSTFPLDSLLEGGAPPDVLKVDVEGAEREVLRGARRTLEIHQPVCLLELRPEVTDIVQWLRGIGYEMYDADASDLSGERLAESSDSIAYNTIAVPRTRQ